MSTDCTCPCHPNGDHGKQYCEECCDGVRPRCKTCKHWTRWKFRDSREQPFGVCRGIDHMMLEAVSLAGDHPADEYDLETHETFGCVEWEAKP